MKRILLIIEKEYFLIIAKKKACIMDTSLFFANF
jgi:hypothetical protein